MKSKIEQEKNLKNIKIFLNFVNCDPIKVLVHNYILVPLKLNARNMIIKDFLILLMVVACTALGQGEFCLNTVTVLGDKDKGYPCGYRL